MPLSEREIFARMIKCESEGEGLNGMRAVATVIMNRVHVPYGEYRRVNKGNIRNVLLQKYQFTCALSTINGKPNPQNIWNMSPDQSHYDVVDWAMSGNKLYGVDKCLWYYNPFSPNCIQYFPRNKSGILKTRIVKHCFYNPTKLYAST